MTPRQAAIAAWFTAHYPDTRIVPQGTYDEVCRDLGESYWMVAMTANAIGYRTAVVTVTQAQWLKRLKETAICPRPT